MYMLWMLKCNGRIEALSALQQGAMTSRRLDQLVVKTPAIHCTLSKHRHYYSPPI